MKHRENSGKPRNLCCFECISSAILLGLFSRGFVNSSQASQFAYINNLERRKFIYNHVFSSPIKPQTVGKNFPLFLPYVSSLRKQLLDIVLEVLIFRNVTFLTLEISTTRVIYWRDSKWCVYFCFLFYFGGGP